MRVYLTVCLSIIIVLFITACSVVTNKPKLYSHKNRIMILCCKGSSTDACSDKQWKMKIKKHCPSGATQVNQNSHERLKYTELPQSGLYEQHVYNYDLEGSIQKNNDFILKRQTLHCIHYQCKGPIQP